MLQVSQEFKEAMVSPVRTFGAEADVHINADNVSEITTFTHEDAIKTIEIQRVGDNSKFFGFGICQRLNMHIVDLEDNKAPLAGSNVKVRLGIVKADGTIEYISYPTFKITERNRQEEEGELSIVGYDRLDEASQHIISELALEAPYTIKEFLGVCATFLDLGIAFDNIDIENDYALNLVYPEGANFAGTESIRSGLNAAAEAIQAIFFVDENDTLRFKRLDVEGPALATITENDYFTFHHKDNRRCSEVWHVTELGDNVMARSATISTPQFIRNNPFWETRIEDIGTIVDNALANVDGLVISQFECEWRGNLPLEIGDKIEIKQVCLEGCIQPAYVFDDVITFDGGYGQKTQWVYSESDAETDANPTNIGDALSHTFAKVDKINREITLHAEQIDDTIKNISELALTTEDITASVKEIETIVDEGFTSIGEELATLEKEAALTITKEDVEIAIKSELSNGVDKVITATGFTFNEQGLTVSKSDSEISTQITEDGMTVSKSGDVVLTANNEGVSAQNLHATTYLIIGNYSRFEDYINTAGEARTGCFWIGQEVLDGSQYQLISNTKQPINSK